MPDAIRTIVTVQTVPGVKYLAHLTEHGHYTHCGEHADLPGGTRPTSSLCRRQGADVRCILDTRDVSKTEQTNSVCLASLQER